MGSGSVIVVKIRTKSAAERDFVEHDHMVQALAPDRTNHPLDIGSLPGGARRGQHFVDAHVAHLVSKFTAEDGVAVAEQVARESVEGKGLPQLLSRPLGGRVGSHIEVEDATPVMGQDQKHVKDLETESGHGEEVDGDQLLDMILQEGAPSLRRRPAGAHHVLAYAALPDVEAKFEQLAVDAGCTPTGILPAHLSNQISDLAGNERSSGLAPSHLPGPEPARASAVPGNDGFGLDDDQCRAPVAPDPAEPDPQPAIPRRQFRAFSR